LKIELLFENILNYFLHVHIELVQKVPV